MTPLALEMLVWFCTRSADAVFPNIDQVPQSEIVSEFLENGIISGTNRPVRATERGKAWLSMILETPLPVQQWIDPRTIVTLHVNGKPVVSEPIAPKRGRGRPRKVPAEPSQANPIGTVDTLAPPKIPRGFTLWEPGPADATGRVPPPNFGVPETAPQPEVSVIWRNGKRKTGPVQIFLWAQAGKPTDIVAYKQVGEPE